MPQDLCRCCQLHFDTLTSSSVWFPFHLCPLHLLSPASLAPATVQALANMLVEVCKNPKSPGFNHYLFESVAALIKHGTAGQPQQIKQYEATLFPAFDIVLKNDVQVRLLSLGCLPMGCLLVGCSSQSCEAGWSVLWTYSRG